MSVGLSVSNKFLKLLTSLLVTCNESNVMSCDLVIDDIDNVDDMDDMEDIDIIDNVDDVEDIANIDNIDDLDIDSIIDDIDNIANLDKVEYRGGILTANLETRLPGCL